jgi:hypothetical protein
MPESDRVSAGDSQVIFRDTYRNPATLLIITPTFHVSSSPRKHIINVRGRRVNSISREVEVVPEVEDKRYSGIDEVRRARGRRLVLGATDPADSSAIFGVVDDMSRFAVVRVDIEV